MSLLINVPLWSPCIKSFFNTLPNLSPQGRGEFTTLSLEGRGQG